MIRKYRSGILVAALLSFAALAADGDLDTSYGASPGYTRAAFTGSVLDTFYAAAVQADGSLLAFGFEDPEFTGTGSFTNAPQKIFIARFTASGAVLGNPLTFNRPTVTGVVGDQALVAALVSSAGQIFLGGGGANAAGRFGAALVRLNNSSGAVEATYYRNPASGTDQSFCEHFAFDADKLIGACLVGFSDDETQPFRTSLIRLNSDLTPDSSWGPAGTRTYSISLPGQTFSNAEFVISDGAGGYYAAVNFSSSDADGASSQGAVIKVLANGNLDTGFDGDGVKLLDGLAVAAGSNDSFGMNAMLRDGASLYVGGSHTVGNELDGVIYKLNAATGAPDAGFDGDGRRTLTHVEDFRVVGLLLDGSGRVLVQSAKRLTRLSASGATDATFNSTTIIHDLNQPPATFNSEYQGLVRAADGASAFLLGGVQAFCVANPCGGNSQTSPDTAIVVKTQLGAPAPVPPAPGSNDDGDGGALPLGLLAILVAALGLRRTLRRDHRQP